MGGTKMRITKTVELNERERQVVSEFLALADSISDLAGCSMNNVFMYFCDVADIVDKCKYNVGSLHQLPDIRYGVVE